MLTAAIAATRTQITNMHAAVLRRVDTNTADIFEAHLLILDDEAVCAPVRNRIFHDRQNAAAAWHATIEETAAAFRALDDEYLRARAADVEDVGRQVLRNLLGTSNEAPLFAEPGILVAADLTPSDTAQLDALQVLGICTALGGPTSHSAILARSLGIPAITGLGGGVLSLPEGTSLVMDGGTGQLCTNPSPDVLEEYAQLAEAYRAEQAAAKAASAALAVTRDGRRVEVVANVGSVADARAAVESGAEGGVGLFRTEFLFLDRRTAPDEDEQYAAYRAVAEVLGDRSVIIRTLDAGGDKPLPYLDMGGEANPFLGWRAIRLCLAQPELFKAQLRAIVRVAAEFPTKIMFPMIATLAEWRAARTLLEEARREVIGRGLPAPDRIETGIMVEIPSAAVRAAQFATEVDFFSIGTNDLTQYTLAAERGNPRVAYLSDAFEPAVLELIRQTVQAAHAHGKWVGVCGELAGDPAAVPLLVGLGLDELSMSAPAIPRAKQIVRTLDYPTTQTYAQATLRLDDPARIRAAVLTARQP
jgi:phosphocarrier protein FPr